VIQPSAQEFLEACGARLPLRLEIEHRQRGEIVHRTISLPFALIGRDERADLRLEDESVSRRHAYLQMVAGRWWWVDLASRTGTHVPEAAPISFPDRRSSGLIGLLDHRGICIGPYTIFPADGGLPDGDSAAAPLNPMTSEADDPSLLPRWTLAFRGGVARQRTWMMDRPLTLVGRASFCKVRLHSSMVSRFHCALLNTASGLYFVDLLGRKGTFILGTTARWSQLEPEDQLQIDPFLIRVRNLAPATLWVDPSSSLVNPAPQALISSLPALPSNVNDQLLLPLIRQFSLMQNQMFEQFQHTLLMMAQSFGNLHREQLALIRQELGQIQELTRQLHALESQEMRPTPPPRQKLPPTPTAARSSVPNTAAAASAGPSPPAAARSEGDIHVWLSQRLAALQQERQTRWQKIMNVLTGK